MNAAKLREIIEKHGKWLRNEDGGERAVLVNEDLRGSDLSGSDLHGCNLSGCNLSYSNLSYSNLSYSDLSGSNLNGSDLHGCNLNGCNLSYSNLSYSNLSYSDLSGSNLSGCDLHGCNLSGCNLSYSDLSGCKNAPFIPFTCPDAGAFIAWKKVNGLIVKLQIPEDAKRCSATSRKCRCDKALVLAIEKADGTAADCDSVTNHNYRTTVYKVGEMVLPDSFNEDRWNECSHGIHFFINRQEAVEW